MARLYRKIIYHKGHAGKTFRLLFPIALTILAVVIILIFAREDAGKYGILTIFYFSPFGMEVGVPFAVGIGIPLVESIVFQIFLDAVLSMWLIWNLSWAEHIPILGTFIKKSERWSRKQMKKYKYLHHVGFIGLVLHGLVPLWGCGAIVNSIIGKFAGMKHLSTWMAIIIGTTIRLTIIGLIVSGVLAII